MALQEADLRQQAEDPQVAEAPQVAEVQQQAEAPQGAQVAQQAEAPQGEQVAQQAHDHRAAGHSAAKAPVAGRHRRRLQGGQVGTRPSYL